jgi:hypothetical protein
MYISGLFKSKGILFWINIGGLERALLKVALGSLAVFSLNKFMEGW